MLFSLNIVTKSHHAQYDLRVVANVSYAVHLKKFRKLFLIPQIIEDYYFYPPLDPLTLTNTLDTNI